MAITPSKLGRLIADEWSSPDETLIRRLRVLGLVMENAADDDLRATFKKAREEHAALRPGQTGIQLSETNGSASFWTHS